MIAELYEMYEATLRSRHLLDFDDLLVFGLRLLRAAPFLCERFKCVLVDEVHTGAALAKDAI